MRRFTVRSSRKLPALAKGQLWKMTHAYVYIVDLGKSIIRFKLMDSPLEACERTLTSGIDTLRGYLKLRHAQLVSA